MHLLTDLSNQTGQVKLTILKRISNNEQRNIYPKPTILNERKNYV
jgi:hypothetical protein